MTNTHNKVLYIGVTSDLVGRVGQHRAGSFGGFTQVYNLHKLLYFEVCDTAEQAIVREKQLKNWHREWKFNLIKQKNPGLIDLTNQL